MTRLFEGSKHSGGGTASKGCANNTHWLPLKMAELFILEVRGRGSGKQVLAMVLV